MSDGMIRIRVGAAADRSVETVFGGIEKRALKTRDNINKALGGSGGSPLEKSMQGIERSARRSADGVDKVWNSELAKLNRIAKAQDRLFERVEANKVKVAERAARDRVRLEEKAARDIEKANRDAQRRADREAQGAERTRRQFAERTAWRATKFLVPPPMGAIGAGRRIAGDMLRGAGIDFSLQGSVQRGVSLQQGAAQLANSAYIAGSPTLAGQRVSGASIEDFVRRQALAARMSSADTLAGLQEFVGRTGDLATAQASLPGLLKLGKATGTKAEDLLTFAGTTAATMYDTPARDSKEAAERAEMVNRIANIAAQSGKLGTTEISDLAKYGPKLAATAQAFGGDPTKNMGEMFALAQLGLKGGAASPAQATTSVASMLNTLRTPARRKQFKANGVELESQPGVFRSASDIITDSIVAAGTDTEKFKSMWANVQGARSVEGLRRIYLNAGGGDTGVAAIREQFKQLGGGTMSQADIDQSANAANETISAKAQQFQERWDAVIAKMSQEVLPSLERLADPTIKLANLFSSVVQFAADMPVTFGGLVVAAAVLRAGIESMARNYVEQNIMRSAMPGLPGSPIGGAPSGIGAFFTGGRGYTGARGVINSQAGATLAPLAAIAGVTAAIDQGSAWGAENGGWEGAKSFLGVGKGKGWGFDAVDDMMNQDAKRRAEVDATVASGDGQGKNAPQLSAEDLQRALIDANSRGIRILNLNEIKLQPGPPTVDPAGRSRAPGE